MALNPVASLPTGVLSHQGSHFNNIRGSGQSWLPGITRRLCRRRHRHPAGLGSGGEAPYALVIAFFQEKIEMMTTFLERGVIKLSQEKIIFRHQFWR